MKTSTAVALPTLGLSAQLARAADERPNILLVMVDDMGWPDIGCYGGEVLIRQSIRSRRRE